MFFLAGFEGAPPQCLQKQPLRATPPFQKLFPCFKPVPIPAREGGSSSAGKGKGKGKDAGHKGGKDSPPLQSRGHFSSTPCGGEVLHFMRRGSQADGGRTGAGGRRPSRREPRKSPGRTSGRATARHVGKEPRIGRRFALPLRLIRENKHRETQGF